MKEIFNVEKRVAPDISTPIEHRYSYSILEIEKEMIRKAIDNYYSEVEKYLNKNLFDLGYDTSSNQKKRELFSRITRLVFECNDNVEYWIDYGTSKATLIGITTENRRNISYDDKNPFVMKIEIG
jgi:hypothetical protein